MVGLADRSKHYPRQLSGGQEQRVAIARAIVADPAVLVADEPTGDLDAKSAEEILNLLQTLNREFKKTIVMVTHDPRAASRAHVERHLEKGVLHDDRRRRHDGRTHSPGRVSRSRSVMKYPPYILKHLRKNWIRTGEHRARAWRSASS